MDPAADVRMQMQAMLGNMEMKLADTSSSGADFIQTSKEFMASKFFTEPKQTFKDMSNYIVRHRIAVEKPIDLMSVQIGWKWKIATDPKKATPVNKEPNYDSASNLKARSGGAAVTIAPDYDSGKTSLANTELNMTVAQIMNNSIGLTGLVGEYLIRKLRIYINGDLIGTVPPSTIVEPFSHWHTFISVFFNTYNRPEPFSLSIPGRFMPTVEGAQHTTANVYQQSADLFYFDNQTVHNAIIKHPLTRSNGWTISTTNPLHTTVFHLGKYIRDHLGIPTKWLVWGNLLEVELELHDSAYALQYALFRSPDTPATAVAKNDNPVLEYDPSTFVSYLTINDQQGELFQELVDLQIGLSPLVYRRPYYVQRVLAGNMTREPRTFNVQLQRRPRIVIIRALQMPKSISTGTDSKYNFHLPYPFRWIPIDFSEIEVTCNYMTQSYLFKNIVQDLKLGDGQAGTAEMYHQFKDIIGMVHHKRGNLHPISGEEFLSTWPCLAFRLDAAPHNSIVYDNHIGFGSNDFEVQVKIMNQLDGANKEKLFKDDSDIEVKYFLTIISDSMTKLNQSGHFTFNYDPSVVRPLNPREPITEQRFAQIASSGTLINLLERLRTVPTQPSNQAPTT